MRAAFLTSLVLAGFVILPSSAAEHAFSVTNKSQAAITGIVVRGGQILDFKKVPSNGTRELTLSLPDGTCQTRLTFAFDDSDSVVMDYDACESGGVDVDG